MHLPAGTSSRVAPDALARGAHLQEPMLEYLRVVQLTEEMLQRRELCQDARGAPRGPPEPLAQVAKAFDGHPGRMGFLDLLRAPDPLQVVSQDVGCPAHSLSHRSCHPLVRRLLQRDFPVEMLQLLGKLRTGFGRLRQKTLRERPSRARLLPADLLGEPPPCMPRWS